MLPHIPTASLERIEVIRGPAVGDIWPVRQQRRGELCHSQRSGFAQARLAGRRRQPLRAAIRDRRCGHAGRIRNRGISSPAWTTTARWRTAITATKTLTLSVTRHFRRQSLAVRATVDANGVGEPGPYGSDPRAQFHGHRPRQPRRKSISPTTWRITRSTFPLACAQEIFGSFFLNNTGFTSPYGFSYNKDIRGQGEARTVVSVAPWYTTAFGAGFAREQVENTFITDSSFRNFSAAPERGGTLLGESLPIRATGCSSTRECGPIFIRRSRFPRTSIPAGRAFPTIPSSR